MKKMVSFRELKEFCEQNKPHLVSFCSVNQNWHSTADTCQLELSFPVMSLYENPNFIYLKSGENALSLSRIKFAKIDTETSVLGTLITVFCGNFFEEGYDTTYTLIAENAAY